MKRKETQAAAQWKDPDYRAMLSDRMKQLRKAPDLRVRQLDRMKKMWSARSNEA